MSENLWPSDFGEISEKTPVGILREQGSALGQRTANIVVGRAFPDSAQPGKKFRHVFSLYCSPLSYQTNFIYVDHDIGLYPADILVDGEDGPPARAGNTEEFSSRLKEIFSREMTKKTIASLIAQSKQ